jgi:hypothetical protein
MPGPGDVQIVLTPTPVLTGNYTANPGELVRTDATTGSLTVTLPYRPAAGTTVEVKQVATTGTNTTTVACQGSDVLNYPGNPGTSMTLKLAGQGARLQYQSGAWIIVSDDLPLGQLDTRYTVGGGVSVPAGDLGGTNLAPTVVATHLTAPLPAAQGGTGASARVWAGLLTPTPVKTSAFAALAGNLVPVDTTGGAVTITLPAAPTDATVVAVKHVKQGGTNAVTVAAAGSDVFNLAAGATSLTLPLLGQGLLVQYKASTSIWYVVTDDLPLGQLDARYLSGSSTVDALGSVSGNLALATSGGNYQTLTLAGALNITGITGPGGAVESSLTLYITQAASGGPYGITWPGSVSWLGGGAPAINPAASGLTVVVLESLDGGTSWHGAQVTGAPALPLAITSGGTGAVTQAAALQAVAGQGVLALLGDGSDGSATFDGTTTILGLVPSSSTYTLTRDIMCTDITVNTGVTVKPAGYRIHCQGPVINNGTISAAGLPGSGGAGGSGTGNGSSGGGKAGGGGQTGAGSAGTAACGTTNGAAGAGGAGASGTAGAAGAGTAIPATWYKIPYAGILNGVLAGTAASNTLVSGAPGGGGGGGDGTHVGGGGGSGGGLVIIFAASVVNTGTITAAGGNGAAGNASGNCGGGGGGGGGSIYIYTLGAWTAGTTSVAGGSSGAASGTGSAGSGGAAGTVANTILST